MSSNSSPDFAARRAAEFVQRLAALAFTSSFNPYSETCGRFDLPDAPMIRRRNLELLLTAALRHGVDAVWVARDLSFNGGRRTGLPMTDELRLGAYAQLLRAEGVQRATSGPPIVEQTSRIVWSAIRANGNRVWLWNVFPLHPHEPGRPFSNRAHKAAERDAGLEFLDWLLSNLRYRRTVAIGRDAEAALRERGVPAVPVRHPSHGGQNAFRQGIEGMKVGP